MGAEFQKDLIPFVRLPLIPTAIITKQLWSHSGWKIWVEPSSLLSISVGAGEAGRRRGVGAGELGSESGSISVGAGEAIMGLATEPSVDPPGTCAPT